MGDHRRGAVWGCCSGSQPDTVPVTGIGNIRFIGYFSMQTDLSEASASFWGFIHFSLNALFLFSRDMCYFYFSNCMRKKPFLPANEVRRKKSYFSPSRFYWPKWTKIVLFRANLKHNIYIWSPCIKIKRNYEGRFLSFQRPVVQVIPRGIEKLISLCASDWTTRASGSHGNPLTTELWVALQWMLLLLLSLLLSSTGHDLSAVCTSQTEAVTLSLSGSPPDDLSFLGFCGGASGIDCFPFD